MAWKEYLLEELLSYEQPGPYIVNSTNYDDSYTIPVLTAGKSFILGYTNESDGVYTKLPVIIFDDFTTASQYVTFPFKVKSSAMKILSPNQELVNPKFIFYRMQIINFDHGTHKRYWIQEYSKLKVCIPPIDEQNHIVEKIEELLSELDNGVETLKKTKQQLAVYRQAVISSAFCSLDMFVPMTHFFEVTGGLTKHSHREDMPIKLPYLRVANVYFDSLDMHEIKTIGVTPDEIKKTLLLKDDILFVEGNGSKEQIGRVALWDGSIDNCVHQNHLIKARKRNNLIIPKFALYYLMSANGRKQIMDVASSTSGLYTLSTNKIRTLQIPCCDIKTQQACIDYIDSKLSLHRHIEETVDRSLDNTDALRQSILKQAFEGRL